MAHSVAIFERSLYFLTDCPMETAHDPLAPAPVGLRCLALLLDYLVVAIPVLVSELVAPSISTGLYIGGVAYMLLRDTGPYWKGQSIGKRLMKLRVVRIDSGAPLEGIYWAGFIRTITLMVPLLNVFDLAYLMINPDQRWGDWLAGTMVIVDQEPTSEGRFSNWETKGSR